MKFQVYKKPCKNCLFTKDRIVSKERKEEIVEECIKENTHFICHKSTKICCSSFHKKYPGLSISERIAHISGGKIEYVELPPDQVKLLSYTKQGNK